MRSTTLLHISDSHVVAQPAAGVATNLAHGVELLRNESTASTLQRVLTGVEDWGIELIVHTGDVVDDGHPDSYRRAAGILRETGLPVEAVPGNHDDPARLAAAFGRAPELVRVRELPAWRLVLVHSQVPGEDHGSVGGARLEQLEKALDARSVPTVVAMHHPPVSSCPDPSCNIADGGALLDLLDTRGHVAAVLSGHLHLAGDEERDGVLYLRGPATSIQLDHHHPLSANNRRVTPVGARVVELFDDGTIEHRLVWLD